MMLIILPLNGARTGRVSQRTRRERAGTVMAVVLVSIPWLQWTKGEGSARADRAALKPQLSPPNPSRRTQRQHSGRRDCVPTRRVGTKRVPPQPRSNVSPGPLCN
eukprot:165358-Chlamydomonas_euryale.AAC.5